MNEVLFRVIREDNKEIIGYERIGERGQWEHIRVNRDEWLLGAITDGQEYSKFIRQQFTGLTDKNGVKIFEDSDLVNMKFTIVCGSFKECSYIETKEDGERIYKKILILPSILTIRNPKTGYEFYNKKYNVYTPLWSKYDGDIANLEVIGNIHDNTELLK